VPTTPIFAFPYPALTDAPNGAAQIQALAQAVETSLNTTNSNVTANQVVVNKFSTGVTVTNQQNTSGTTASAAYTATLTGGTTCSLTFVAPPSASVLVINSTNLENTSSANTALMAFEIRQGASIGAGTVVFAASDTEANTMGGSAGVGVHATVATPILTGLVAGNTFNCRQMFRTSAGTGTFANKRLTIVPIFF
jgi:hypothetical protein